MSYNQCFNQVYDDSGGFDGGAYDPISNPCSELLGQYLRLEQKMLEADTQGNEQLADDLRDKMDPIWYQLANKELEYLNERT
jgi:hypothetical protein